MSFLFPTVPPEQMTKRARLYLLVVAAYAIGMAVGLFVVPEWFNNANFKRITDMLPFRFQLWAVVHCLVGGVAFYAAWRGSEAAAYAALISAFVIVSLWALAFIYSAYNGFLLGEPASWSGAVTYTTLAMLHLIQARQPIRSPFDPFLRSLVKP